MDQRGDDVKTDASLEKLQLICDDAPKHSVEEAKAGRISLASPFKHCLTCNRSDAQSEEVKKSSVDVESMVDKKAARKHGGWKSMPFIFGNEICEKLAAIGFSANLIVYLTQELHMDNVKAANALTNFGGTSSLTPLIGAFLADAYVGRFWIITVSSIIYCLGMCVLTLTAMEPSLRPPPCSSSAGSCVPASNSQLAMVFLGFLLTAIGSGGIRPCVAAFGADQFDASSPEQSKKLNGFFNWYYFCMGVSALLAVTVIVYVQDNVGWAVGFGIPTALMLVSIVSFFVGLPLYVHEPPMGGPLIRLARVLVAVFRKRSLVVPDHSQQQQVLYELNEKEMQRGLHAPVQPRLLHTPQFR